jgi:hypothetical protein
MIRLLFSAVSAAVLAGVAVTAQAKTTGSPLGALQLKGHWVCTQAPAGGTFSEDWAPVFHGLWLRATDSAKGTVTAEHTVSYNKASSTWIVLDAFATGSYDVLHATTSSPTHIAFHAVYPQQVLSVIYNRDSAAQYTIDVHGNVDGKNVQAHNVCTKH